MKIHLKALVLLLAFFSTIISIAQEAPSQSGRVAKFTIVFSKTKETKDGYYLNGYLVNIARAKGEELDGKKIEVKGRVTIVKGIGNGIDENGAARQGRREDIKYIKKPKIRILR